MAPLPPAEERGGDHVCPGLVSTRPGTSPGPSGTPGPSLWDAHSQTRATALGETTVGCCGPQLRRSTAVLTPCDSPASGHLQPNTEQRQSRPMHRPKVPTPRPHERDESPAVSREPTAAQRCPARKCITGRRWGGPGPALRRHGFLQSEQPGTETVFCLGSAGRKDLADSRLLGAQGARRRALLVRPLGRRGQKRDQSSSAQKGRAGGWGQVGGLSANSGEGAAWPQGSRLTLSHLVGPHGRPPPSGHDTCADKHPRPPSHTHTRPLAHTPMPNRRGPLGRHPGRFPFLLPCGSSLWALPVPVGRAPVATRPLLLPEFSPTVRRRPGCGGSRGCEAPGPSAGNGWPGALRPPSKASEESRSFSVPRGLDTDPCDTKQQQQPGRERRARFSFVFKIKWREICPCSLLLEGGI